MAGAVMREIRAGASVLMDIASRGLDRSISRLSREYIPRYPGVSLSFPVTTFLTGETSPSLGDIEEMLECSRRLLDGSRSERGEAALPAAEAIEWLSWLESPDAAGQAAVRVERGVVADEWIRRHAVSMIDRTIPGVAALTGSGCEPEYAASNLRTLLSRSMIIFAGDTLLEQALRAAPGIFTAGSVFAVSGATGVIHMAGLVLRARAILEGTDSFRRRVGPLDSGGLPGEPDGIRIRAVAIHIGQSNPVLAALHAGIASIGFPVVLDEPRCGHPHTHSSESMPSDSVPGEYVVSPPGIGAASHALDICGIPPRPKIISIPVGYGWQFEGETFSGEDLAVALGHRESAGAGQSLAGESSGRRRCRRAAQPPAPQSFEIVRAVRPGELVDERVSILGGDVDELAGLWTGEAVPLGIELKVYGRKMRPEFEGVLQRRIHLIVNRIEGVRHVGQGDSVGLEISRAAAARGLTLRNLGEALVAGMKAQFPGVVARVEARILTDRELVSSGFLAAAPVYAARERAAAGLADERVEQFYACAICQSLAPHHVCVITPGRPGICGGVGWADAMVSHTIDPYGPNKPVDKGECIDPVAGAWAGVNEFVRRESNGRTDGISLYRIVERPHSLSPCVECIAQVVPEVNGVAIAWRLAQDAVPPTGVTFWDAVRLGGDGLPLPGFTGFCRRHLVSGKFLAGDGGLGRVVWMPRALKEILGEDLSKIAAISGLGGDFAEKVADDATAAYSPELLVQFLKKARHPALDMNALF